jgi:hypothetical protein
MLPNSKNTDGREALDWESHYPRLAVKKIAFEAVYLAVIIFVSIAASFITWSACFGIPTFLTQSKYNCLVKYILAFFGGSLGGSLFDVKWLIHSVAKKKWHLDRRLWRFFVPLMSGCFSALFVMLISSGILKIFDSKSIETPSLSFGFGFMVGYFSDSAIAKLSELANTLFGTLEDKKKKKKDKPKNEGQKFKEFNNNNLDPESNGSENSEGSL